MILGQTLQTARTGKALGEQETCGDSKFFSLRLRPAVDVLQKTGKGGIFKGSLQVLVPTDVLDDERKIAITRADGWYAPSDEFVENVDILLHLCQVHGLFGVDDGEGRDRGTVFDEAAAWLEEASDEEDLEEGVCILEEFEGGACLD